MFNFHGPPATLMTRSRVSVSDVGLDSLRNSSSITLGHGSSSVSLPPIAARTTRSLTMTLAPSVSHHHHNQHHHFRPPPQQPAKRPTHREMILLTLRHVQSVRGLTFDQLSSFIRGAFEFPKSPALDLKLSKTLSNMISRGLVLKIPGLGAYDAMYQLVEEPQSQSGLDLCVQGRSVQEVPMWPTGYSLPNGGNFLCRSSPKKDQQQQMVDLFQSKNLYCRRNPLNKKLEPMPYMPLTDPMISQSFGARVGLTGQPTGQRPNSPTTIAGDHGDDDDGAEFDYSQGMWMASAAAGPEEEAADKNSIDGGSPGLTPRDPHAHPMTMTPFDRHQPQLPIDTPRPTNYDPSSSSVGRANSVSRQARREVPRILDTVTSEMKRSLDHRQIEGENGNKFYVNHIHNDSHHQLGNFTGDIAHLDLNSPDHDDDGGWDGGHSKKAQKMEEQKVETLEEKMKRLSAPSKTKNGQQLLSSKKLELMQRLKNQNQTVKKTRAAASGGREDEEDFDIFCENFKETLKEFQQNNTACHIMNDFGRLDTTTTTNNNNNNNKNTKQHDGGGDNGGELRFDNQIDYLMGIADIIDSYGEKPPPSWSSSNLLKSRGSISGAGGGGGGGISGLKIGRTYRK